MAEFDFDINILITNFYQVNYVFCFHLYKYTYVYNILIYIDYILQCCKGFNVGIFMISIGCQYYCSSNKIVKT